MTEDKFKSFVKEASQKVPERPENEWSQIAARIESEDLWDSKYFSFGKVFGGLGAIAAAAVVAFFIMTIDTVKELDSGATGDQVAGTQAAVSQTTGEVKDSDIADFLFEEELADDSGQEYSETYIALID